jgi:adenylylsulfate kinase
MADVGSFPCGDEEGATVWLTGLPSAGKSTVARAVADRLVGSRRVEVLDGDEMRERLFPELGFSRQDREANVRRIGYVARLLASNGVLVLASVISPFAADRAAVREHHANRSVAFFEVHVATAVDVCSRRDVKGLYARQAAGQIAGLTGVDSPYEAPKAPDLRLDTAGCSIAESVEEVCRMLSVRGHAHDRGLVSTAHGAEVFDA